MPTLVCFGLGYCAQHYVAACETRFTRVVGTVRSPDKANALSARNVGRSIEVVAFDGTDLMNRTAAAIDDADAVLVSVPPGATGDPVLGAFAGPLAAAPRLTTVVYLSSVGIYGDHGGAFVDETTPPRPRTERSQTRLAAEAAWQIFGRNAGVPVAVLRLAGIYGPGRNALTNLLDGKSQRIIKPGQVFNRVHVADIAQAIDAAFARHACGIFNVSDDEPGPPHHVIEFAAGLLGFDPPPAVPFADAQARMTPMMRSFYGENRRVSNLALKTVLGVQLRYPTFREGLLAEFHAGLGTVEAQ